MADVIEKYIKKIKFSMFSPEMVRKMSVVKLVVPDTYNDDGYPIEGGLADTRMGVIDPGLRCKTCGGNIRNCPGHFGSIELVRPAMHPEYGTMVYMLLRSTCKGCRRILISNDTIDEVGKSLLSREELTSIIIEKVKRVSTCPHCNEEQEKIKFEKPTTFYSADRLLLQTEIRDELAKISDDDLRLLGFDPEFSRPEWVVLTVLMIPPVSVRPSITLETGERSEDDLTHKLVDIMRINQRLDANINAGAPQLIIEDLWELLQYHVATYFNNESANIPPARHRSGRPLKTLTQRLKGKEGRFRYNLSGKRVNFSARTVVSPDGTISINEVGVPRRVANELTVPINVTDWNIEECKAFVRREEHPRAVYAVTADGKRRKITDLNREEILTELAFGWTIERQLKNGDVVLFNRHPSLHRMSIMSHEVKVLPGKTFRVAPSVTEPYNADFDGDEMNIHVPQSEEARAEAELLMKSQDQIISPRHGHATIRPTEDHISGAFVLTKDGTSFTKEEVSDMLMMAEIYEMPKPDLAGGRFSGKHVMSQLIPKDVSMTSKTKFHGKKGGEGIVSVKAGKVMKGAMDKRALGDLLEIIVSKHGTDFAAKFIDALTKISAYVITQKGFSVSMQSYTVSEELGKQINQVSDRVEKEVNALVMQYQNKTLERAPGRTLKETVEDKIMMTLGGVRGEVSKMLEDEFGTANTAIVIAKIGARGSIINIEQMSGILSQQAVREKRLRRGYRNRVLAHFKRKDIGAKAKGYISTNFMKGVDPIEYFFQAMGGRESMVDTAIRTARSGYMQRRFVNALQDLSIAKDLSVRDASGRIVETLYGGDGKDPMRIKKIGEELSTPVTAAQKDVVV